MAFQIVINLIIAMMWMFLSESYSISSFIAGYVLGILLLLIMRRLLPGRFYLERFFKIIQLIYTPKPDIEPGIFAYETELKSDWELTLLANLITLTPGTLSVAISNDNSTIYIHAMDIDDIDESIQSIKNTFEKAIMEVTR